MSSNRFLALALPLLLAHSRSARGLDLYVSPRGNDRNPGTRAQPLRTLAAARDAVRLLKHQSPQPITVVLRAGTYCLPKALTFTPEDSGTRRAPITYAAAPGEQVVVSGGMPLKLSWAPYKDGIYQAAVPAGLRTDQLFVNGEPQVLARYPNFDPSVRILNGYARDAISPERAARWAHPAGGFIHAMHPHMWGDAHYRVTGKNERGELTYEGGWQNNRPMGLHEEYRYVENIFEELDTPHEWFLDDKSHTLYYYPPAGLDLASARVEAVRLPCLVEMQGTSRRPVRYVRFRGITFQHATRTFMQTREPLLRSDWCIYRGGAVFLQGCEHCAFEECSLEHLGGNALFLSGYNRDVTLRSCLIRECGANGVCFVGSPKAVRNPLFNYDARQSLASIDRTPGPKTDDYPARCLVDDCLITRTGRVEKQTAPVQIAMARAITVRNCSLYDVPRAGINIGDGCWGGHVIEFCDIFDTVKETGDHGSFNSWGRDRYWGLSDLDYNHPVAPDLLKIPLLDAEEPTILRNNRWRCDHGWDIDLDDGSTNYRITDNLCLNGGIKLREGFNRICANNVMVGNSFHPHVWFQNSQDVFRNNIVFTKYQPIGMPHVWGTECDFNLENASGVAASPATELQNQSGQDAHSLQGDAEFINPAAGDYRVRVGSPALALGFHNFPMDRFGVRSARLRAIARTPVLPVVASASPQAGSRPAHTTPWLGATIKNVTGLGEISAAGLPGEVGVWVVEVPADSGAAHFGLKPGDVIRAVNGKPADSVEEFLALWNGAAPGTEIALTVRRSQHDHEVRVERARQ
jgi:hypothetical protein